MGLVERDGALAAYIGLQIGHQQSRRDAFAGNVANHEADAVRPKREKVVVVAADVARRKTDAGKLERFENGEILREEARLDLLGDFEFLSCAPLSLYFIGKGAALRFDGVADLVKSSKRERIAVGCRYS